MTTRLALCAGALVLGLTVQGWAQPSTSVERGKIVTLESGANVVVLDSGRMFRITPNTVILVDEKPVTFSALQPGTAIVLRSAEPVVLRDGQYVAVVAAPTSGYRQTVYGQVKDIDKNGEVTIRTPKGELEVRFSPDAVRGIKKGDTVTLDVTVGPPGSSPSALPSQR